VADSVPAELRNRLGIAVAMHTYRAYRELLASPRWCQLATLGARPQRLLWASTGTKDPNAPASLYVEALAAPDTINTMPEKTLKEFAEHGELKTPLADDGGDADAVLTRFAAAGVDVAALALRLQRDGAAAFVKSWRELLDRITQKSAMLEPSAPRSARQSR
jgi:transaldolase